MRKISDETRYSLLRQHGHFPIAYSVAFQPDLEHFGDDTGFFSYCRVGGTAFVLGDPIAPAERHAELIDSFLAQNRDASFWQISKSVAGLLNARRFFVNAFGSETIVDLPDFTFGGPTRRSFRTAANRFDSSGYAVRETAISQALADELLSVSHGWRQSKATKSRELSFLVRPAVLSEEPGVRKFLLFDPEGSVAGFAFFDPVFEGGNLTGYLATTRRWSPETDKLAGYLLMRRAIETFQSEGIGTLHLGLSPFHQIEDHEFNKNWVTRRAFRFLYRNGFTNRFLYPVRPLSEHKSIYGGTANQVYVAFNQTPALKYLIKLARACRIV